jgi:hypothetical protein
MMKGGTKAMQSTSPYAMVGLGAGLEGGVDEYTKGEARKEDLMSKLRTGEIDLAKLTSTERNNLLRSVTDAATRSEDRRFKGIEAKDRATDRTYNARLGAYTRAFDSLLKARQDKLGLNPLTTKDYEDIRREANSAADDFISRAQGQKVIKLK